MWDIRSEEEQEEEEEKAGRVLRRILSLKLRRFTVLKHHLGCTRTPPKSAA